MVKLFLILPEQHFWRPKVKWPNCLGRKVTESSRPKSDQIRIFFDWNGPKFYLLNETLNNSQCVSLLLVGICSSMDILISGLGFFSTFWIKGQFHWFNRMKYLRNWWHLLIDNCKSAVPLKILLNLFQRAKNPF